ncbi:Rrf2 family transcriptional regulator [uncultured Tateyamaria sp.]|nr:Rrf2 family transcriptional regulator [uncultured Tateyamaria sp.]
MKEGKLNMASNTRFALSVHTLCSIAVHHGRAVPSERIAKSAATNPAIIRKLYQTLSEAGFIRSTQGPAGGALLQKDAAEISLNDVYRAVDGGDFFPMHRSVPDKSCFVGRNIQKHLKAATDSAVAALENELRTVSIKDLADALEQGATETEIAELVERPFPAGLQRIS